MANDTWSAWRRDFLPDPRYGRHSGHDASPEALRELARRARAIPDPLPDSFDWKIIADGPLHSDPLPCSGPALSMLASTHRFYRSEPGSPRWPEGDARLQAVIELGRALIERGARRPDWVSVELAILTGVSSFDMRERLEALDAWGPELSGSAPAAAARAAREAIWGFHALEAWEWIKAKGGLADAAAWTSLPQASHPAVCSLQSRHWKGFRRAGADGVALDWRDPISGATLWHFACVGGHQMSKNALPVLKASPAARAIVDLPALQDEDFGEKMWRVKAGSTPLHLAVAELEIEAVATLLELGANPNAIDGSGRSPLHILGPRWGSKAQDKAELIVRALIDAGADPGLPAPNGKTLAQLMAAKGPIDAIAALLETRPADVGGDSPAQREALAALLARDDGSARSIAERAAMRASVAAPAAPPRPSRNSL